MNSSAVAVHGALLLSALLAGLLASRRDASSLLWPGVGLIALACASAAPAGSAARAILGIAIALPTTAVAGSGSLLTSAVAGGAFVSLAAAAALGVERTTGYTLYAVAGALLVLATAARGGQQRPAARRWVLATAAIAVAAPLLDFAGRWVSLAPWATLPHALALAAVALRREPPHADPALAARLDRLERELGLARRAGTTGIVAAAAVHELKGLLADLGLASEFAAGSADASARERAAALVIETAEAARARALRLLDDMQRTEREVPAACLMREALEEAAAAARPPSAAAGRVSVEAPPGLACLLRRREICLALTSLTRNALAASARAGGSTVTLRAAAAGPAVEIELSDEAGGLPLDVRLDGFDAPVLRREGLGLVLAARLIEQNGGRLDYLSAEGRSSFRVTLPGRVDSSDPALL